MERDFSRIARKVDKEAPLRLRGSLSIRPTKLAFIINESISLEKFQQIVEYQSTLWGGRFSLFIPTDGNKIHKNWMRALKDHNADLLICCYADNVGYSTNLIEQLSKYHDALKIHSWHIDRDFTKKHFEGFQDENGLATVTLLSHFQRREKTASKENSNAAVLVGEERNPYYLYLAIRYGSFKDQYLTAFLDIFKAKEFQIADTTNVADYLRISRELQGKFTPLSLTGHGLRVSESLLPYNRPNGLNIFILGNRQILDLCLAWNFRLVPNLFGRPNQSIELILSTQDTANRDTFESITSSIKSGVAGDFNGLNLHSLSVSPTKLQSLGRRLSQALGSKAFSVHRKNPPVAVTQISNKEVAVDLLLEDGNFVSKIEQPAIDPGALKGVWINEFQFRDSHNRRLGFPDSSKLNGLLSVQMSQALRDQFGFSARQTNNGLSFKVSSGNNFVSGRIPSDFEALAALFEDRDLHIRPNTNHSYIAGLKRMFSEIGGQSNFSDKSIRHLLWEAARSKKSLRVGDFKGLLRRNDDALIDNLIRAGVFLRGIELVCENCGLRHWYSVDLIREVLGCIGCQKKIRLPLNSAFTFKLNQLVTSALLAGGGMALLLLEHFLSKNSLSRPISIFGTDVYKADTSANFAEIDLMVHLDGQLVLAECKDFRKDPSKTQYREALSQVKKTVKVAKVVGAEAVLFASFSNTYLDEFSETFKKLSTTSRLPVNVINLQTEEILNLNTKSYARLNETPYFTFFGEKEKK